MLERLDGRTFVTRLAMAVTACGLLLAAPRQAEAQLGALVSPGPLAKAHANLEGVNNCEKCHARGRQVSAARCLTCHAPVAERIARKTGVHRHVTTDCVSCHVEHAGVDGELRPFDTAKFNHAAEAAFALDGQHAPVAAKCASCHKARSFLTANPSCVTCHADVHTGSLGPACTRCHSTQVPFKSATKSFDHTVTRFPLLGAHRTATCERCHAANTFKGVKFAACTNCHKSPHAPAVSTACVTCHTNDNWKTKKFDHARTSFPLVGKHVAADCAACHKAPATKVKPAAGTCVICHRDPHGGEFAQDCKSCHSEAGFSGATFDHSGKTRFGLTDGHAAPACRACHTNVTAAAVPVATKRLDFRGLKTGCVTCHADPHQGELAGTCEACHSTKTFRVSSFVHPRTPEFFGGQHAALACASCHKPGATPPASPLPARAGPTPARVLNIRFTGAPTACASCHTDVHAGQVGTDCQSCHSLNTAKFTLAGFSHDRATFRLTGKHQTVACALCHKRETATFPSGPGTAVRLTGMSGECRTCHADVHLGQIRNACETCHTTSSFKVAAYQHRNPPADFFVGRHVGPSCEACHKHVTAAFPAGNGTAVRFQVGTTCISCHADVHNGALGQDCARCHKPAPPVAAHFTRRSTP